MASPKHNHPKQKQHRAAAKRQQRPLVLRRAMLHSLLCFLLGLLGGLAPSGWTDAASRAAADANTHVFRALHAINNRTLLTTAIGHHRHRQRREQQPVLLVVVTTTAQSERERRAAGLTRTAHALRLVSPPVVWLVVEAAPEAPPTARLLRRTGLAYRHLTYSDNFTTTSDSEQQQEKERHHQRNLAMAHIEHHRLRGVVLFAGLADVYDLRLLEQLRRVRSLGAWPVATVWEQERRVSVEGPICSSTSGGGGGAASGWFSASGAPGSWSGFTTSTRPTTLHNSVHGFAFASDLLWDPARWDRFPTSEPDQSQDSIKFVQRLVVEDYNKTRLIPDHSNCSQIMAWRVDATLAQLS